MASRVRGRPSWWGGLGPALALAEVLAVLLAGLAALDWRPAILAAAGAAVLVARAADLHRPRLVLWILEDLPGLLVAALAATAVTAVVGAASVRFAVLALALPVLAHTLVFTGTHLLRRSGRLQRRVVMVGTGATARRLARALLSSPDLGLRPIGFVGTGDRRAVDQARGLPLAMLGSVRHLDRALAESDADTVVVALPGAAGAAETDALGGLLASGSDVYAVPGCLPPATEHARHPRELVGDVPIVHLYRSGSSLPVRASKRVVEALVAVVTLAALLPVTAVLAVLVRVETGGVLVRQARVDRRGRPVPAPRFRTRRARSVGRPGTTFSIDISGRVGPVGRLLRRTRLDLLPALVGLLLRRVRYGSAGGRRLGSATAASADQPQVDAGQLTG